MSAVLCFGELLMRLSPRLGGEWIREGEMPVFIGGAELNAATALALWGETVTYGTALPDNYLTDEILEYVRQRGIATGKVLRSGNRIGAYYLPQGADLKSAGVIYDRAHSSFWDLKPGTIDWDAMLDGVSWFHFSAISPALNPDVAEVCREGAMAASKKGITVSHDLNYRNKLWQYGKRPDEVMPSLIEHCDVVMGNIWAAGNMLGIPVPADLADEKEAYLTASQQSSEELMRRFPKCRQVANTFRFTEGDEVRYYATLFAEGNLYVAPEQESNRIIDRVGSGDTFMAGLIWGNRQGHSHQEIIDFAAAAAFHKLFIKGDSTTATVEQIRNREYQHA